MGGSACLARCVGFLATALTYSNVTRDATSRMMAEFFQTVRLLCHDLMPMPGLATFSGASEGSPARKRQTALKATRKKGRVQ